MKIYETVGELKCIKCGGQISSYDALYCGAACYACRDKAEKDALARSLLAGEETETSGEDDIVCPFCGARYGDDLHE
jgi:DNA-directed RNA polymerase subunit RPC12/RpoP